TPDMMRFLFLKFARCDFLYSYSMKIKKQTRKLAAGCSKHCFEVVDKTDEVSNIYMVRRR
ncbi:TPA: hypothetical protein ACJ1Q8_000001, partial [Streptococcus pneumoniae]